MKIIINHIPCKLHVEYNDNQVILSTFYGLEREYIGKSKTFDGALRNLSDVLREKAVKKINKEGMAID